MKFNTQFIPSEEDSNTRKIATLISVVLYLFTLLLGYSPINYFSISGLIIVQLYFIIANSKESYEFKNNQLIYTNLFYKKTINFTNYNVSNGEYKDSYKKKLNGQLIELYHHNKIVCRIKDVHNEYVFDDILSYLKTNFPETIKIESFEINFVEKEYDTILLLICSFLLLFTISVNIENFNPNKIQQYKTIKGHMAYQPSIDFSGKKNNRKEYLIFELKEYPNNDFHLQYDNFIKLNGYEFIKTNHKNQLIEFKIFEEDNDYKIKKLKQPYFYSHLNNKRVINIQALNYQNKELIKVDYSNKFKNQLGLLSALVSSIVIGLILHSSYNISKIIK